MRIAPYLALILAPPLLVAPAFAQQFGGEDVITTAANGARSVYATDLDGDGDLDVLSASAIDDKIAWYENLGSGEFGAQQAISTVADSASSVYATDLDGDGDADVLSASAGDNKVAWYENFGGGSFSTQQVISAVVDGASSVYATDLDGDGDADVLSASNTGDKIAWYENFGGGSFSTQQVISAVVDGANSVYATDLDGDGDADVLSASLDDDKIAWYENLGGGSFGAQQVISTTADGAISVYASDIDNDGDADVLSASYIDDSVAWHENLGGGNFGMQQVISTSADGIWSVYATDLDGDGDADVLSGSYNDDKIAWYENLGGSSGFGVQQVISGAADGARAVYAADLDGDGDTDVLSASLIDGKIAWYESRIAPPRSFRLIRQHVDPAGSSSYGHAIQLGDLNEDGLAEYGVSDLSLPVFDLFDGATGQLIQTFTATGSTFGIAGTSHPDITGDGIPEYAIGEPGYQGTLVNEGRVWIYSGADNSLVSTIDAPSAAAADPQFGSRMTEFVDLNGDGVNELLVSSYRGGSSSIYAGALHCLDGATSAVIYEVEGLDAYDQFSTIADLGPDLDGDGIPEFAVGARESFNTGDGYLQVLSGASGQVLLTIDGFGGQKDFFGNAHCWTSDQDGDGVEDLVIGAPGCDDYGQDVGRVAVYSSATGGLIRDIPPPADVTASFGASWRSRFLRLPDSDGDGKEEVLLVAREVLRNGLSEGVVYVCSPTTGQVLEELLCPIGPMPGFGVQSEILGVSSTGGLVLVLGGSNQTGSGVSGAFVYEYETPDADQDDDGLADADEASIHGTNPLFFDTDGDGLGDGMELGVTVGTPDTDPAVFVPDADPLTVTDPLLADTDSGGVPDGVEDQNRDGRIDTWETDPAFAADDSPAFYVSNLSPNQSVNFEAYGAEPLAVLIPAYSVRGPGPTALGIGISVNLSLPISTLPTAVAGVDGRASWTGPKVPGGINLGTPVWLQMVEIAFSSVAPRASNPLLLPVGAN